mgnify:CR=1 FL=1
MIYDTYMNIENVRVRTILVSDYPHVNPDSNMAYAVQIVEITEQGFRVRRMNISHNGETYFLNRQALATSHWIEAPPNSQLRFL